MVCAKSERCAAVPWIRARLRSSTARARASSRSVREELLRRRAVVSWRTAGIWLITEGSWVITSSPPQDSSSESIVIESARNVICYSLTLDEPYQDWRIHLKRQWKQAKKLDYCLIIL